MRQSGEHKPPYRFVAGDAVHLSKRYPPRKAAPGQYQVVAQLPERGGQLQYRIKSACEPFYRTVAENELESDTEGTAARPEAGSRTRSPDLPSSKISTDF